MEVCQGGATSRTNLWDNFAHRHVQYAIVILEEGNQTYHHCPKCDMFVYQKSLSGRHLSTDLYQLGEEQKRRFLEAKEAEAGADMALNAYSHPLAVVQSFKYLGRVLSAQGNDWPELIRNFWRPQRKWV